MVFISDFINAYAVCRLYTTDLLLLLMDEVDGSGGTVNRTVFLIDWAAVRDSRRSCDEAGLRIEGGENVVVDEEGYEDDLDLDGVISSEARRMAVVRVLDVAGWKSNLSILIGLSRTTIGG